MESSKGYSVVSKLIIVEDSTIEKVREISKEYLGVNISLYLRIGLPPLIDNLYSVWVPVLADRLLFCNDLENEGIVFGLTKIADLKTPSGFLDLTPKQLEMVRMWASGVTVNKEVASTLGVSVETVKSHAANIFRSLRVRNKAEALSLYVKAQQFGESK